MEEQLVKRLIELNRDFYSSFAHDFAESRAGVQVGLDTIVAYIQDGANILDVGCGNGRLAKRLDKAARRLSYTGVDISQEFIKMAKASQDHLKYITADYQLIDITQSGWHQSLSRAPFDIVVAQAVMHHIPSINLRTVVLKEVHNVLRVDGLMIMTNWQFDQYDSLGKKIVPWNKVGIEEHALEPGDVLLDWRRGGIGYRYCHLLKESEVRTIASQSGFQVVEQYYSNDHMNLYSLLKRL